MIMFKGMDMSFEEMVKKISPKLKGITHRLGSRFIFFNEEDLYQEALIHLWSGFLALKLQDKTESYILQGCYFHLQNYIRKTKDKRAMVSLEAVSDDDGASLEELLPASDPGEYFDYLNSKLIVEKMQNNGLTRKEKEVLALCLEGWTCRQIGDKVGISHVGVIKIKNRIKARYEKFFSDPG